MSVADALIIISKLGLRSKVHDDDYTDQLNHFVTPTLLLMIASATYLKQWLGDPIHCWTPAQFKEKDHFQSYVDNFCWITEMYNVPMSEELPEEEDERDNDLVGFYRWVSIVFLLQALMFKLPNLLWMSWKGLSGLDPDRIIKMVEDMELGEETEEYQPETNTQATPFITTSSETTGEAASNHGGEPVKPKSEKKGEHKTATVARFIDIRLDLTSRRSNGCGPFRNIGFTKHSGNFVTIFFCFHKILYVGIVVAQFFIISSFLNINYWSYGIDVVAERNGWKDWEDLSVFPRIAWCDFQIRQLQNVHTYTVQCVLSMNIFIEKIFAIMWFWFMFLLILSCIGVIKAFFARLSFTKRVNFVKKFFTIGLNGYAWPPPRTTRALEENYNARDVIRQLSESDRSRIVRLIQDKNFIRKFVGDYLKADGCFIMTKIYENSTGSATTDILFRLVECYLLRKGHVSID